MLSVGLTGGFATGKTLVANVFTELGAYVIYADLLGHEVLRQNQQVRAWIQNEFGTGVFNSQGEVDRKALGAYVFANAVRLAQLSSVIHPAVLEREQELLAGFAIREPHGIAVVEAAILVETGGYRRFQKLVVTACDEPTQLRRAQQRDGLSEEQARARLRNQMPVEEKIRYADYVIDTSGTLEDTRRQAAGVFQELRKDAASCDLVLS